jgi:hypothetical protein
MRASLAVFVLIFALSAAPTFAQSPKPAGTPATEQPTATARADADPSKASPTITVDTIRQDLDALFTKVGTNKANPGAEDAENPAEVRRTVEQILMVREMLNNEQYVNARSQASIAAGSVQSPRLRTEWMKIAANIAALIKSSEMGLLQDMRKTIDELPKNLTAAKSPKDVQVIASKLRSFSPRSDAGQWSSPDIREGVYEAKAQIQSLGNALDQYEQLLAAEAEGDTGHAMSIGLSMVSMRGGKVSIAEVVKAKVESLRIARDNEIQKAIDEARARIEKSGDAASVLTAAEALQRSANRLASSSSGQTVERMRFSVEISRMKNWAAALDHEAQKRYRMALRRLRFDELGTDSVRFGTQRGFVVAIITDEQLRLKIADLDRKLADRGNAIYDPSLKLVADAIGLAKSVDDLREIPAKVQQATEAKGDAIVEDQPLIEEFARSKVHIACLITMSDACANRDWGAFWQANLGLRQMGTAHRWTAQFGAIRSKLIRRALIDSASIGALKPTDENKPIDQVVLDQADAALAAEDYRRAVVLLDLYMKVFFGPDRNAPGPGQMLATELQAIEMYAQAVDFESAGDLLEAVSRYRAVIQRSGQRVPLAKATKRLGAILAKKPELAYQQAAIPSPSAPANMMPPAPQQQPMPTQP